MTQEAAVPPGLMEQIRQIAREEAAAVYRSAPIRNASIGAGGSLTIDGGRLRVKYPATDGGGDAVYVGDQYRASDGTFLGTGLLVQGPDDTDMIVARQDAMFGNTRVDIYDAGGRIIIGSDASSEQGLARPYLPAAFYRRRYADMTVSTTSPTFETLWEAQIHKQHPRLEVGARGSMDTSGTTGEIQVLVNGVALGSTFATGFVITPYVFGPAGVAGAHMSVLTVEIRGRVTSGSGALRIEPQYLVARQSP